MSEEMVRQLPFVIWAYGLSLTAVLLLIISMVRVRLKALREIRMLEAMLSKTNKASDKDAFNEGNDNHD